MADETAGGLLAAAWERGVAMRRGGSMTVDAAGVGTAALAAPSLAAVTRGRFAGDLGIATTMKACCGGHFLLVILFN